MPTSEPAADEFFATSSGVCVYVHVGSHAIRVEFDSAEGAGHAKGVTSEGAAEAEALARGSLQRFKLELQPLFERLASAPGNERA